MHWTVRIEFSVIDTDKDAAASALRKSSKSDLVRAPPQRGALTEPL
jgi:hypothetical protein